MNPLGLGFLIEKRIEKNHKYNSELSSANL